MIMQAHNVVPCCMSVDFHMHMKANRVLAGNWFQKQAAHTIMFSHHEKEIH